MSKFKNARFEFTVEPEDSKILEGLDELREDKEFRATINKIKSDMYIETASGMKFHLGDVFDLGQTVNGYNKFIITKISDLTVHYVNDDFTIGREYEYDVEELIGMQEVDDCIKIIGRKHL